MNNHCQFCELIRNKEYEFLLFESRYWKSYLSFQQHYPGRSIIVCKRHVETFDLLTDNELIDYKKHFSKLTSALKQRLDVTCFNVALLMNGAYAEKPYNPHVHFHIIPRYDHEIDVFGHVFSDETFGNHYVPNQKEFLTEEERRILYNHLVKEISENQHSLKLEKQR